MGNFHLIVCRARLFQINYYVQEMRRRAKTTTSTINIPNSSIVCLFVVAVCRLSTRYYYLYLIGVILKIMCLCVCVCVHKPINVIKKFVCIRISHFEEVCLPTIDYYYLASRIA